MTYTPSEEILDKYADVLINYALNDYAGVKPGETVVLQVSECAKPMLHALYKTVLKAGANPIVQFLPDGLSRTFFECANDDQLAFFPEHLLRGRVQQADHFCSVIGEVDKHELKGVPPDKIMRRAQAFKPYRDWREEKENAGKLTWTYALYGTQAMADEVGSSLEEYWDQIIRACYLDEEDPVSSWKQTAQEIEEIKSWLDSLKIQEIRVVAENTDLTVRLGPGRKWLGASGRNIPSFEVFISPDWRGTNGHIQFTEPLYRYGNLIKRARLEFTDGIVTSFSAEEGEDVLKEMLKTENANKVGEFSLTDKRHSRITRFMGETLFDENVGGEHGNTHIAIGNAYKDSYPGDPSEVSDGQWQELGYNESVEHCDIVSTAPRVVTATLADGSQKVIYENGSFTL